MKYEIILIDLDETIFDFKMAEKMALGKTIQAFGLEPTEEVISRYHEINRGLWAQLERGEVTHQQVLEDRFGNLFAAFGMEVDKAACGRAYGDGLSERHYWLPGAEEALEKLQGKYRLFIASNGTASVQRRRMDSADLYRFFEDIFVSQEIGADKPNPAFFEGCFAKIPGFDRSKAMIVGDRISSDIVGGNNAGIATCWVNAAGETHDPAVRVDYEIKSLAELPELLEKL
jgi:2-haloacid dehalogenase